jgi:hypothetical protein
MATHISQKMNTHLPVLREAVNGSTDLRSNQKLYKKVYKYYKDLGIYFTGDSNIDYDTVLDCLYEDVY